MKKLLFLFGLLFAFSCQAGNKITVFAAASLTDAMQAVAKAYQQAHPETEVSCAFASSSVLAKQIAQGAEPDLYLSADQKWIDYLLQKQLISQKTTLLRNSLVLIAPKNSPLQPFQLDQKTDWQQLQPKDQRLAIGDPDLVPAGIYAKQALTKLGVYQQLQSHFAISHNVRNALMLVERDEAPLGIVYRTDALISAKVKIVATFPNALFAEPIEYPAAALTKSGQSLLQFLQSSAAQAIFQQYGFAPYVAQ